MTTDRTPPYKCGSCGHLFYRHWKPENADEDLTTCPCEKCGAQSIQSDEKPFEIYRDSITPNNLIGNLPFSIAEEIHGDNILCINHDAHRMVVKYEIPQEVWDDIKIIKKDVFGRVIEK
jgi:hypothetical protein